MRAVGATSLRTGKFRSAKLLVNMLCHFQSVLGSPHLICLFHLAHITSDLPTVSSVPSTGASSAPATGPSTSPSGSSSVSAEPSSSPSRRFVKSSAPSSRPSSQPSTGPSYSQSGSPSASASASPSESPSLSRRTRLSNLFVSYNVSIEDLETLSSPQYFALDWMADEDSTDLQDDLSDDELVERFVLVVIYYATGGATWGNNRTNFLNSTRSTCSWKDDGSGRGVGCNDEGSVAILVLSKFPNPST